LVLTPCQCCCAAAAFHPTSLPHAYAPGYGLPFTTRISGPGNNTCAKNTAILYATYTLTKSLSPPAAVSIGQVGIAPGFKDMHGTLVLPPEVVLAQYISF
jgi:hypothetical protein